MAFRRPFFFLLVDSFLLPPLAPFCAPSCAVEPSALGVSALAAVSAVPVAVVPPAEFPAAAGAFGSGCTTGFASLPSAVGATLSAPSVVALPPGRSEEHTSELQS